MARWPKDLEGAVLPNGWRVTVVETPRPYVEQTWFHLYALDAHGHRSREALFSGLFSAGRASEHIAGWVDGTLYDTLSFPCGDHPVALGEEVLLEAARLLGRLVPPGGRLWLAYETFDRPSELHERTQQDLARGVPLALTPIGLLLVASGCWAGLRDWYIPEGGREGPRKLQGNKPLHAEHAQRRRRELLREVEAFVRQHATDAEIARRATLLRQLLAGG